MRKELNNVDLKNVDKIIIEDDNIVNFIFSDDNKTLNIFSNIKPHIIDANFKELDKRLSDVESTIKMRILGQLNNVLNKIEKLSNE